MSCSHECHMKLCYRKLRETPKYRVFFFSFAMNNTLPIGVNRYALQMLQTTFSQEDESFSLSCRKFPL